MNPWLINPPWQHFSSLFRESVSTKDEPNEFIRYHHLTSTLYFGIAFIEALLNRQYREILEIRGLPEDDIIKTLRDGSGGFRKKFNSWPELICGRKIEISEQLIGLVIDINDIRSELTHPKTWGGETYEKLDIIDVGTFVDAVAEFAVALFSGRSFRYPYWIFGWNYVGPSGSGLSPMMINDQQFVHSLASLGLKANPFDAAASNAWRDAHMRDVQGYRRVKAILDAAPECEPIDPQFPYMPRLCKRWWDSNRIAANTTCAPTAFPTLAGGLVRTAVKFVSPIYGQSKGARQEE